MKGGSSLPPLQLWSSEFGKSPGLVAGELDLRAWDWILFSDCIVRMGTKCTENKRESGKPSLGMGWAGSRNSAKWSVVDQQKLCPGQKDSTVACGSLTGWLGTSQL